MLSEITVTFTIKDNVIKKVSENFDINNLSKVVLHLKHIQKEANELLTNLVNNSNSTNDLDLFDEDDDEPEDDDENKDLSDSQSYLTKQKRVIKEKKSPKKRRKRF